MRLSRRSLGVVLGLWLGWHAAGMMSLSPTHAEEKAAPTANPEATPEATPKSDAPKPDSPAAKTDAKTDAGPDAKSGAKSDAKTSHGEKAEPGDKTEKEGHDKKHHGASKRLVPQRDGEVAAPDWYSGVLTTIVLLFAAAIVLGVPIVRAQGPEPDPAVHHDDHDDHDDHAHGDDHGHGDDAASATATASESQAAEGSTAEGEADAKAESGPDSGDDEEKKADA